MSTPFAVFDIDGTLIRWQLYHAVVDKLVNHGLLGPDAKEQLHEARMVWKRREHAEAFKEYEQVLVKLYEAGVQKIDTTDFDTMVTQVIDKYKDQTYVYTRNLLHELKEQGYLLFIVSGSHHELIEQLAKYYGFDDWIGTRYEREGKNFSGERFFAAADKKKNLQELVTKHAATFKDSLAIGDSGSDIAMLELVENPIAFNPDKTLFDRAKASGWPIVVERKNVVYKLNNHIGDYILQ